MVALPESARTLLSLEPPESIVEVWRGAHRLGRRLVQREVAGFLVLTSRKVAFIQVVGIGRNRTFHLQRRMAFPLETLTELREDPPGILRVSESEFRLLGPTAFAAHDMIERCRVERLRELSGSGGPEPGGAPPRVVMERIIIREIVKVPCRYCGALLDHGAHRCPACGAPVTR